MKIAIVGSGKMGSAIGRLLSIKGHLVKFSFSRDAKKLMKLANLNPNTSSGSVEEAIQFAEVVLLSVGPAALQEVLSKKTLFTQKIVITCVSGLQPDFTGETIGLHTTLKLSIAEHIQNTLEVASVVEAFNMTFSEILQLPERPVNGCKPSIFYCGDDAEAKKVVATLIEDCDYIAVNAGGLRTARSLETLATSWVQFVVVAGMFPRLAMHTLRY